MRRRSGRSVLVAVVLVVSSLAVVLVWYALVSSEKAALSRSKAKESDQRGTKPAVPDGALKIVTQGGSEVTLRDHKVERVVHKDGQGLAPLEWVSTPEGKVEIRRVFNSAGEVISEEAYRNGVRVPVPPKTH